MDKVELENWQRVKDSLEAEGKTDNMFYKRAVSICAGNGDLIEPLEDPKPLE